MTDVYFTDKPSDQNISHVWRTSIQKTIKGGEKRSSLYTWPRVLLKTSGQLTTDTEINRLKRNLINYVDELWWIPLWTDETTISSQAASGQKIINVGSTSDRHFYAGRKCIIINPDDTTDYEYGTIDSLTSSQITVVDNLSATWPVSSLVIPLYAFRFEKKQSIAAVIQNYQKFDFNITEAYETARDFTYSVPASGADTYESIDLFLQPFHGEMNYSYNRDYSYLQYLGLGVAYSEFDAGENIMGIKASLMRSTRSEIWETLDFFDSKQGRLSRFWVPTWSKDIVPNVAIGATDTVINIENIEYTTHFLPNDVIGRYIYIQFPDNSYVCRKIIASTAVTITLDSQIGTAVSTAGLDHILDRFLNLSRFNIDEMKIEYQAKNPDIAKISIGFTGIVEEAV